MLIPNKEMYCLLPLAVRENSLHLSRAGEVMVAKRQSSAADQGIFEKLKESENALYEIILLRFNILLNLTGYVHITHPTRITKKLKFRIVQTSFLSEVFLGP